MESVTSQSEAGNNMCYELLYFAFNFKILLMSYYYVIF